MDFDGWPARPAGPPPHPTHPPPPQFRPSHGPARCRVCFWRVGRAKTQWLRRRPERRRRAEAQQPPGRPGRHANRHTLLTAAAGPFLETRSRRGVACVPSPPSATATDWSHLKHEEGGVGGGVCIGIERGCRANRRPGGPQGRRALRARPNLQRPPLHRRGMCERGRGEQRSGFARPRARQPAAGSPPLEGIPRPPPPLPPPRRALPAPPSTSTHTHVPWGAGVREAPRPLPPHPFPTTHPLLPPPSRTHRPSAVFHTIGFRHPTPRSDHFVARALLPSPLFLPHPAAALLPPAAAADRRPLPAPPPLPPAPPSQAAPQVLHPRSPCPTRYRRSFS